MRRESYCSSHTGLRGCSAGIAEGTGDAIAETVGQFGSSGSHTVYVLNAAPASPWSTAAGNQLNPWVPVLEYACTWAQGKSQPQAIVATITTGAYNSLGKTYDGNQTRTSLDGQCNLALLLSENVVDCKDMAAVVQLCANAVGVANIQVLRIDGPFAYKPIKPIGHSTWNSGAWNHHMHAWYGSAVYDACIQVRRAAPYVPVADSLNGSYKSNLFDYGTFVPQSPINATITQ